MLALAGAVLLVLLYLATLFCALFDASSGMVLFKASAICTILVPILLWGYTVIYRLAKGKTEEELTDTLRQLDASSHAGSQAKHTGDET